MKETKFSKKTMWIALLAALGLLAAAIPAGVWMANKTVKLPPADPIVFRGGAYTSGAADVPEALRALRVSAEGAESRLIPVSSSFLVQTDAPTDTETLTKYLSVSPEIPMSVTRESDTEYRLTPAAGALEPGQLYRISVGDPANPALSYAFQTETELRIRNVFPADYALDVPTTAGIEIAFTDAVTECDWSKLISVAPAVKGHFQTYPDGRTVAFVPDKPLAYDTVYEVTVKPGIPGLSGKKTAEGRVFRFRTWTEEYEASTDGNNYSAMYLEANTAIDGIFSPGSPLLVSCFIYGNRMSDEFSLTGTLYRLSSFTDAARAVMSREQKVGDALDAFGGYGSANPSKVGTVSAKAERGSSSLDFGVPAETGVYLAEITAKGKALSGKTMTQTCYVLLQVTNLRVFTASSDGKTAVWVNAADGSAAAGASVEAVTFSRTEGWKVDEATVADLKGKTDAEGLWMAETGSATAAVLRIADGDRECLILASLAATEQRPYYMSHVYTDRETYFSDDTVHFWGFAVNSYTGEVPQKLYLQTGASLVRTPVTVRPDGTFEGSLSIEQMGNSYLTLKFCDADDLVIAGKSIHVTEEEKPQYTASLSFDRLYYRRGDRGTLTLKATFFDGTPAPNLSFAIRLSNIGDDKNVTLVTDGAGEAKLSFTAGQIKAYMTDPVSAYATAELTDYETQRMYLQQSVLYFHSELMLETDYSSASLGLYRRDFSRITSQEDLNWNRLAESKGKAEKGSVSYTLKKFTITKTQKSRYNTYTKQNEQYWVYDRRETVEKTGTAEFTDGKLTLPQYEVKGFTGGYYYNIEFYDSTSKNSYSLTLNGSKGEALSHDAVPDYPVLHLNQSEYRVGDTVSAYVTLGDERLRVLWILAADGMQTVCVGDSFRGTYDESMIPGARLYAAVINENSSGAMFPQHYIYVNGALKYDSLGAAGLTVEISTDRQTYRPGEQATVTVRAPGAAGGTALLSVVDEACFAIGAQEENILAFFRSSMTATEARDVYRGYYSYYDYLDTGSHRQLNLNGRFSSAAAGNRLYGSKFRYSVDGDVMEMADVPMEAEKSGASGETETVYVRQNFADNPVFLTVPLDASGCGTLLFTVPDNITSWRITALAETGAGTGIQNMKLGCTVTDTVCTQPFFLNLSACQYYLVGDTLSVAARSYGAEASGTARYTAVLADEDGRELARATASADCLSRAWLHLGSADTAGQYVLTVYAKCGDASDAVQTRLQVVDSALTADVRRTVSVEEIASLQPKLYPVTLTFFHETAAGPLYNRLTQRLKLGNGSMRSDMLLARYAAIQASEALFGTVSSENDTAAADLASYGSDYLSLLPYAEGDPALTALALAACPEIFPQARRERILSLYYEALATRLQTDDVSLCVSLAGVAALGEPVLDRIYAVCDKANGFSDEAKLYLALALACTGDYSSAAEIYGSIREACGEVDTEYGTLRLKARDEQTAARLTSLALAVTSRVARGDAEALARYLEGNVTECESSELALASYLRFFLPTEPAAPKTLVFTLGDVHETVTLEPGRGYTVTLNKAEMRDFRVDSVDDGITVRAAYRGTPEEAIAGRTESSRVQISKRYEQYRGDYYRVTLTVKGTSTRVSESFTLTDCIPAGARFFRTDTKGHSHQETGGIWQSAWLSNPSGQNITGSFHVYNQAYVDAHPRERRETCPEYSFEISISYIIRGAVTGHFSCEPAFIRNDAAGIFSVSESYCVEINDDCEWVFKQK